MKLIAFSLVAQNERSYLAAIEYLEKQTEAEVCYETEKKASHMQTVGPHTTFEYSIEVYNADTIFPKNLYPIVRALDTTMGELE